MKVKKMQVIIISVSVLFGAYFSKAVINIATIVGSGAFDIACNLINLCQ
jgi:hypothetical protein